MRDDMADVLEWTVTGMDCGSCAGKVRQAVERLPGVEATEVALMTERLRLRLIPGTTSPERIEATVRAIGFGITPLTTVTSGKACGCETGKAHDHRDHHSHDLVASVAPLPALPRWYATAKARYLIATGALLGAAWGAKFLLPVAWAETAFLIACLAGLYPVARRAFALLRAGVPFTIESLMTVAASGAIAIGAAEEAAVVVFLFAVGEFLESLAADRARRGIRALSALLPETALLVHGDHTHFVPAASLRPGQTVRVRPGDRLPCDGRIVAGSAGLDESAMTGESLPVLRSTGDTVIAGSICTDAALDVEVTVAASDNTIARIARMVDEAESTRAPTQRFIEAFARVYTPLIFGTALLVALVPPLAFGGGWQDWTYRALTLLLVGCPCALVIAVPTAIASALSRGTRLGLLFKGGAALEAAATVTHVAMDKTGTLTEGAFTVTAIHPAETSAEKEVLLLAASVEQASSHPLARAILAEAAQHALSPLPARDARALPGIGAEAVVDGALIQVASLRHAEASLSPSLTDEAVRHGAASLVVVLRDGLAIGLIALQDRPRTEAADAVNDLRRLGINPIMLTGDNAAAAQDIAAQLSMEFKAGLLPNDKVTAVRALGLRGGVMMVGDGINDAPALKAATVGVAMGNGTDFALEAGHAAILRNDLLGIPAMIRLARETRRNILQNVTMALALKAIFLALSVTGGASLWMAILADTGATVLVTLNALRLQVWRGRAG